MKIFSNGKAGAKAVEIRTVDDIDPALKEMAVAKFKLAEVTAPIQQKIAALQQELQDAGAPWQKRYDEIESKIEGFARTNAAQLFAERATLDFQFGTVKKTGGESAVIDVDPELPATLELAKKLPKAQREALIEVKEAIKKAALKKLDAEQLALLNAKIEVSENFKVQPARLAVVA